MLTIATVCANVLIHGLLGTRLTGLPMYPDITSLEMAQVAEACGR